MPVEKVALVTGASRGLGAHIASRLAAAGHRVVGCSRSPHTGAAHDHVVADISREEDVGALVAHVSRTYGRLDYLINNAAVASMNHSLFTPYSTLRSITDINLIGTFLVTRSCARLMRNAEGRARVVNFTSVAVPLDLEGEAAYAASKAAVESLTRIFAKELAPLGITVNAVGPGPIHTDLIKGVPAKAIDAVVARQALRRMGTPDDVMNVIEFFLRQSSDFVTGQILYLGGVS